MKLSFSLRRKKKDDAEAAADAPAAAAEGSKSKASKPPGGGGAQEWLFLHVEKLVCLAVVGLLGWLVYSAAVGNPLTPTPHQTPNDLKEHVQQIDSRIKNAPFPEQDYPVPKFTENASRGQQPISADAYSFGSLAGIEIVPKGKRKEPKILLPRDLVVRAGHGMFLVKSNSATSDAGRNAKPIPEDLLAEGVNPVDANMKSEGRRWVSIVGVLPYAEQLAEYDRSFKFAFGYDPQRDVPKYIVASFQRLEVQPGTPEDQLDWSKATTRTWRAAHTEAVLERQKWIEVADELIDPRYVQKMKIGDQEFTVTQPLGPLAQQSWKMYATHPQIPLGARKKKAQGKPAAAAGTAQPTKESDQNDEQPPTGGLLPDFLGEEPRPAEPEKSAAQPADAEPVQPAKPATKPAGPAPLRLLRIFDFSVQPGKTYRYRIKLHLLNPNKGLPPRYLDVPASSGTAVRETEDWTASTAPVYVPTDADVIAHEIAAADPTDVFDEPSVQVVVQKIAFQKGGLTIARLQLRRGSLVHGNTTLIKIAPASRQTGSNEGILQTNVTLLDMRGGESVDESTATPAELLLLDESGRLIIKNSADDVSGVQRVEKLEAMWQSAKPKDPKSEVGDEESEDEAKKRLFGADEDEDDDEKKPDRRQGRPRTNRRGKQ